MIKNKKNKKKKSNFATKRGQGLRTLKVKTIEGITAHLWCDSHSTSISTCGVWGARAGIQIFRRKLYTHIHLNYVRIEFLSCKKNK